MLVRKMLLGSDLGEYNWIMCNFECCTLRAELLEILRSCLVLLVIFVFFYKKKEYDFSKKRVELCLALQRTWTGLGNDHSPLLLLA